MAGKIDEMVKKRLQTAGQWKAFLERRDELKAEGYSPDDARMAALGEFLSKCDDDNAPDGEIEGAKTIKIIEQIQAIGKKYKKSA